MISATLADRPKSALLLPVGIAVVWIALLLMGNDVGSQADGLPVLGLMLGLVFVLMLVLGLGLGLGLATRAGAAGIFSPAGAQRWVTASLLVAVVFVLSLSFRKREIGEVDLDWQNGLKLAMWVGLLCVGASRWRQIVSLLVKPELALAFSYAGIALVSAAWSPVPSYTAACAIGLIAYLLLASVAAIDLGMHASVRLITYTLLAYVVLGLAGGLLLPGMTWLEPMGEEVFYRLQGFSSHPNVFGQEAGLLLTFAVIAHRLKLIRRPMFWFVLLVGTIVIVLTNSKTTLVAVMLAWGLVAARNSPHAGVMLMGVLLATALVLFVMAIGAVPDVSDLLGGLSRSGDINEIRTLTGRTELWSVAWEKIAEKPLLGWGYNGTEELLSSSMDRTFYGEAVNAHNVVMQTLVSLGFLGSLPLFALMGRLIVDFIRRPDRSRDQLVALAILGGISEVSIAGTPVLLTLLFFCALTWDAPIEPSVPGGVQ